MTLTRAEFLRSLEPLGRHYQCRVSPDQQRVTIDDGPRRVRIELGPESVRRQGALRLPTLTVSFSFHGFDADTLAAFRQRFELSFRRGGG